MNPLIPSARPPTIYVLYGLSVRLRLGRLRSVRHPGLGTQDAHAIALGVCERDVAPDPGDVHGIAEQLASGALDPLHRSVDVVDGNDDRRVLGGKVRLP